MLIKEYRIVMPLTVDEVRLSQYRIGQLWTVANFSKKETGGGDGVEILVNEPFTGKPLLGNNYPSGQYTKKRFYGQKKVGGVVKKLLPASALIAEEESWNSYPYTRTIITNEYLADRFYLKIETLHLPGKADRENVHQLSEEELKNLEVIFIDIAAPLADPSDYIEKFDPTLFKSRASGRGELKPDWIEKTKPLMTCYKLVTVQFKWYGLQKLVEEKIHTIELRLFTLFNREVFCRLDKWEGMSIEQVREYERKVKQELNQARKSIEIRGLRAK